MLSLLVGRFEAIVCFTTFNLHNEVKGKPFTDQSGHVFVSVFGAVQEKFGLM